jgi:hypothetical protein
MESRSKKRSQGPSLTEKEEQDGSNILGNKEFAFEETEGREGDGKESHDQGDEDVVDNLGCDGGGKHNDNPPSILS